MDKERALYDKFVDTLNNILDKDEPTDKELNVVLNFLKNNDIKAAPSHKGVTSLTSKIAKLPFDDEDFPQFGRNNAR